MIHGAGTIGARSKVKITAIQTGTGNPPVRLICSPQNIGTLRRRLGVIFCRARTGPHPINAYLIEHPEGLIVVDTGDTARKSDRGYMPRLIRRSIDIRVAPEEEIGTQLSKRVLKDKKSELGLSHFEVRKYQALMRHLYIGLVSHLFLARQTERLRRRIVRGELCRHWRHSAVDRHAIERALVEHGHLLFTRRRIPLTIQPGKVARDV